MKNQINGLYPAQDCHELQVQVKTLVAYAKVDSDTLEKNIVRICDGLSRVNTPHSNAIAKITRDALKSALEIFGRVERETELRRINLWVGMVEMGWV